MSRFHAHDDFSFFRRRVAVVCAAAFLSLGAPSHGQTNAPPAAEPSGSQGNWLKPSPGSASLAITAHARTHLPLGSAISIALARNPLVLRALSEIERQHGVVIEARAAALPQLGVNMNFDVIDEYLNPGPDVSPANTLSKGGGGTITIPTATGPVTLAMPSSKTPPNTDKPPNESWLVELAVTKNLYDGGATRASIAQSKLIEDASMDDFKEVCLDTILAVRQFFYDAIFQRGRIVVEEESVKLLEEDLQDQRRRFEAGTVPRFNVLRAEVAVYNELPKLIEAKNAYRVALQRLAKILAIDYAPGNGEEFTPFAPDGELEKTLRSVDLVEAVGRALQDRPVLAGLQCRVEAERQGFLIARSGWLPRFSAHFSYLFQNDPFWDAQDRTDSGYAAGVAGQWDLFDGFATWGRVRQSRQQTRSAELDLEDQRRQVELDTRVAYSRYIASLEFMRSQEKNVELAIESLRLARSRFDSGAGTQLDVLDARTQLTQAALNELDGRYRYQLALADIDRATAAEVRFLSPSARPAAAPGPALTAASPPPAPPTPAAPPAPARKPDYRSKPR